MLMVKEPQHVMVARHVPSDAQVYLLNDTLDVLDITHEVQQLLSAEKTPTLPMAMPLFEEFLINLKEQQRRTPYLAPYIEAAIEHLVKYMTECRLLRLYGMAMGELVIPRQITVLMSRQFCTCCTSLHSSISTGLKRKQPKFVRM
jgi:hypothetical protein